MANKAAGQPKRLAETLVKCLTKNQWTLSDLSKETGISVGHLSRLISGQRNHSPTLRTLKAVSRVAKVPVEALF